VPEVGPETVSGSSARAFASAFLFVFALGTLFAYGGLVGVRAIAPVGPAAAEVVIGCAGLSAILARLASFEVATSVTISDQGITALWRGPFGGRASQHLAWDEIRRIDVNALSGTFTVGTDIALKSVLVTVRQARAILRHPRFPLSDLPPRVRRLGDGPA